ncbi:hypothetical protein AAW14_36350 [Streptomyces hygroscopicus]|uniref:hypothetical protein n=1 Tax=Streptomyces hygroscopicus TaxID=1912 RepID=UPI0022405ED6|nr:hypothetical protein [Streptomyces hygroscopicus]MCW7947279.1 hypothetical protein [Streptomyces hygroscopicus]
MNKIGLLLGELHDAECDLATEYRAVAGRQAADAGTHYPCLTLAQKCDTHATRIREMADRYAKDLSEPHQSHTVAAAADAIRHKTSELLGHHPQSGLLLLRDLRQLYVMAQAVGVHWILLGQVAQAIRDASLFDEVTALHKETLTQVKWLTTRLKDAAPQALATRD